MARHVTHLQPPVDPQLHLGFRQCCLAVRWCRTGHHLAAPAPEGTAGCGPEGHPTASLVFEVAEAAVVEPTCSPVVHVDYAGRPFRLRMLHNCPFREPSVLQQGRLFNLCTALVTTSTHQTPAAGMLGAVAAVGIRGRIHVDRTELVNRGATSSPCGVHVVLASMSATTWTRSYDVCAYVCVSGGATLTANGADSFCSCGCVPTLSANVALFDRFGVTCPNLCCANASVWLCNMTEGVYMYAPFECMLPPFLFCYILVHILTCQRNHVSDVWWRSRLLFRWYSRWHRRRVGVYGQTRLAGRRKWLCLQLVAPRRSQVREVDLQNTFRLIACKCRYMAVPQ